ncbi:MAG: hypothetical protein WBF51_01760 [Candidatus Dormiibacterota bacterium]
MSNPRGWWAGRPGMARLPRLGVGLVVSVGLLAAGLASLGPVSTRPTPVAARTTATTGGAYTALAASRLLDTRYNGETLGPNSTLNLTVTVGSVPADATAVALNVTATDTTAASYLTVYPAGGTRPLVSNVNWAAGQTVPNLVIVQVGAGGAITFYNALGRTDVLADLEGYFAPEVANSTAGSYVPLTPSRITDTRPGSGDPNAGATLGAGSTLNVQVTGAGGVPSSGVTAAILNFTVTDTSSASFLTVYQQGAPQPLASNLNWSADETVANRVVVPVSPTTGEISVYNAVGRTDVVVDVDGYFTDGTNLPSNGSFFTPIAPARLVDSRFGGGTLGAGGTYTAQISGQDGISSSATAAVLNITATNTTASSFFTVYPGGVRPTASDMNWTPERTVANLTVATLTGTGTTAVFNAAGSADLIIDAFGYFTAVKPVPVMVSVSVTTSSIAITYNESVSCDPTGSTYGDFTYDYNGSASGGSVTACSHSTDVLTLSGTFTLPTGSGTITYTAPASSTTVNAVYATGFPGDWAATQTLSVAQVPAMVSASVTTSSITITYNVAVSCDPTGTAYSDFVYDSATATSGGTTTACSSSSDVLSLAGTFVLPTNSGSIAYTAPATSTTSNAVYSTVFPTVFAATQTLAVRPVPAMVSVSVTTSSISITYNVSVSCDPAGTAYTDFVYDSATATSGGTITACSHSGEVLTLAGTFTLPTGTASITYTAPGTSTTTTAVYATAVPTDFAATQTLPG